MHKNGTNGSPCGEHQDLDASEAPEIEKVGDEVSIAEEAARIRAMLLEESRSATLVNLFDYLFSRVGDARAPKEIEVAMAVFGKSGGFDTSQNSMVRSHIHRLRQRLDKYNAGRAGPRLAVPKGEYRLILINPQEECGADDSQAIVPAEPPSHRRLRWLVGLLIVASAVFWIVALVLSGGRSEPSPLARTKLWQPVIAGGKPPVIAAGDIFLIGTIGNEGMMEMLSTKSDLQSGEDLTRYLIEHPDEKEAVHDRDIYRVPTAQANVVIEMLKTLSNMAKGPVTVVPISKMSQDQVDSSNIVFIQYLSQLSAMRSPILHLSGFAATEDSDVIRDKITGVTYAARSGSDGVEPGQAGQIDAGSGEAGPSGAMSAEAHNYGTDYGYIARIPGPAGHQNLLISGLGDAALQQMAKLVRDRKQLDELARQTGSASEFEALYRVRTVGGLVFETRLVVARPLGKDRPSGPKPGDGDGARPHRSSKVP